MVGSAAGDGAQRKEPVVSTQPVAAPEVRDQPQTSEIGKRAWLESRRTQPGVFLLLRRLRSPLIVLIVVYAVAVFGFTLIPGVDDQGRPWRMGFFHAFYFVSFLGTTIGLGEIPHPFSDAQRLWALLSIYATVVAWLYGIGQLLATLQDPLFKRIVHENRVGSAVRRMREPFVLLCGYDDAGTLVARELAEDGLRSVVVDLRSERVEAVEVDDLRLAVPALRGDAIDPGALLRAGITHPHCMATLALTGDDRVNLAIVLTAKLLNPQREVICVAHKHLEQAGMAKAGADHIINPHDTFAERLAVAMRAPSLHVIYEALTTQTANAMGTPMQVPRGRWLVCGYGRFGCTVRRHLVREGAQVTVIDQRAAADEADDVVNGSAVDIEVLRQARAEAADAIVIATDNDTDNLAIAVMLREVNPAAFLVIRQNQRRNTPLFRALEADIGTLSGYVVAAEVLRHIRAPQLSYFLKLARQQDEAWAHALLERMRERIGHDTVEAWSLTLDAARAPACMGAMAAGRIVTVGELLTAPDNRKLRLHAVPLLLQPADGGKTLLPDDATELHAGDRLLMCGRDIARRRQRLLVHDDQVLAYVLDGDERAGPPPWPVVRRARH